MKINELEIYWKRIFELEWKSLCNGSKPIAAVIVSDNGDIISEGRNKSGENTILNPRIVHGENEAIRKLDIRKYPYLSKYKLYAALEPCCMCMGTIAMSGIRKVVIAASDDYGGAVNLIDKSSYMREKNIRIEWEKEIIGVIQKTFQAIYEIIFDDDENKREEILEFFSKTYLNSVIVAKDITEELQLCKNNLNQYMIDFIFDYIIQKLDNNLY